MGEVLNCDADGCGHVEHVGTITDEMIGMPCPVCGADMLTQDDWIAWQPYSELLNAINAFKHVDGVERTVVRVGLHGPKTIIQFDNKKPTGCK